MTDTAGQLEAYRKLLRTVVKELTIKWNAGALPGNAHQFGINAQAHTTLDHIEELADELGIDRDEIGLPDLSPADQQGLDRD